MKNPEAKRYERLLESEYPDLYAFRRQKIKKMLKNIAIYEFFFLLIAYGAYDYIRRSLSMFGEPDIIWKAIILGAIIMVIPPLCFKSTLELLTPTWVGTVTSIKYEMRYTQADNGRTAGSARIGHPLEFMKMKVETEAKKKRTLAYRSRMNSALQTGDRIVKFRGFTYPTEISEDEKLFICIACGKIVKKDTRKCPACLHSIVDLHTASVPKNVWTQFDYADFE